MNWFRLGTVGSVVLVGMFVGCEDEPKYIMPENGTTDFAFMLIPAEGMYYDLFINKVGDIDAKKLIEFAFAKKVIICSPSGFYAYLQTVLQ